MHRLIRAKSPFQDNKKRRRKSTTLGLIKFYYGIPAHTRAKILFPVLCIISRAVLRRINKSGAALNAINAMKSRMKDNKKRARAERKDARASAGERDNERDAKRGFLRLRAIIRARVGDDR